MAGIHRLFKPISGLLRPSETGIGEQVPAGANTAAQKVIDQQGTAGKRKRKEDEQRAKIGRFVAENGNAAALKKEEVQEQYTRLGGEHNASVQVQAR